MKGEGMDNNVINTFQQWELFCFPNLCLFFSHRFCLVCNFYFGLLLMYLCLLSRECALLLPLFKKIYIARPLLRLPHLNL